MPTELDAANIKVFEELQELVALEVKDILAAAAEEGYAPRDVVGALELALRAEIEALAAAPAAPPSEAEPKQPLEPDAA